MPAEVGGVVTEVQLEADLRGMHSHGLRAVPMYVERVRRGVGNNPLAWAFPADREPPLCFDVATSVVAGGKIDLAAAEGDAIPPGWGIDGNGVPTVDAKAAAAGGLAIPLGAPAAPHKGFGLALVLEALAGVLAGARFGRQHTVEVEQGQMPWDEGHFFLAFDPGMV